MTIIMLLFVLLYSAGRRPATAPRRGTRAAAFADAIIICVCMYVEFMYTYIYIYIYIYIHMKYATIHIIHHTYIYHNSLVNSCF